MKYALIFDPALDAGHEDVVVARDGRLTVFGGNNTSGPIDVAPARNACASASASGRMDFESEAFVVSGTLQANGKAAGSATQQDAENGMLVVHGTQDPDVLKGLAHPLGRNSGQENALLAFSCKDHGADAGDLAPTLRAMGHGSSHPNAGGQVAVCITGEITHTLKARVSTQARTAPAVASQSWPTLFRPVRCGRIQPAGQMA